MDMLDNYRDLFECVYRVAKAQYTFLNDFEIEVYYYDDFEKYASKEAIEDNDGTPSPFMYANKNGRNWNSKQYQIFVDHPLVHRLNFNARNVVASFAHELGHIIHNFQQHSKSYEDLADKNAAMIVDKNDLIDTIQKLINSGLYDSMQIELFKERIERL